MQPPLKKPKLDPWGRAVGVAADVVPKLALTIATLDGSRYAIAVPDQTSINELKVVIKRTHSVDDDNFDLFSAGSENALPGAGKLCTLDIKNNGTLFMLAGQGTSASPATFLTPPDSLMLL